MKEAYRNGLSAFGGIVVLGGIVAAGIGFASPTMAQPEGGRIGEVVSAAIEADGPIVTEAEKRLIQDKCGYGESEWSGRNIMMRQGVLHCANGRQVDDPEVRAVVEAIGERARARVEAVMNRPEVRRAMSGEIEAEVRERMRRFDEEERPRIAAAVARARASVDAADIAAIRAAEARAGRHQLSEAELARIESRLAETRRRLEEIDIPRIERQVEEAVERSLREHRRERRTD